MLLNIKATETGTTMGVNIKQTSRGLQIRLERMNLTIKNMREN